MIWKPLIVILSLAVLLTAIIALDPGHYLTLGYLQSQYGALMAYRLGHPLVAMAWYFALHVLITGLSLPGMIVMSLAGGAVFGLVWGTVLVSFASAIGSTLAFLAARYTLRDVVRRRLGSRLRMIDASMEASGSFYLFGVRLVPVIPYFLVNLWIGMTPIPARTFYWISQLGMLPLTIIYVNAGTQFAQLNTVRDILSPALLGSLLLVILFPWLTRWLVKMTQGWFQRAGSGFARSAPISPAAWRFDHERITRLHRRLRRARLMMVGRLFTTGVRD
ncbi:MAG: TVP38/TMEM64 family protein [Candidatus Competibacter sp.]|nr:TVP38/TMEM64 family protein [Candidatus Competibacter sp.]